MYKTLIINKGSKMWVSVSSISKIFEGLIRDMGFNPRLHKKLIGILI